MDLFQKFIKHINEKRFFVSESMLTIAVSGGVDSVVLCELCHKAGYNFQIAHCNFQLRGDESDRDEKFVKGLGKKYGVKVYVKNFETEKYAEGKKISIQEAARDLRYQWFEDLVKSQWSMIYVKSNEQNIHNSPYTIYLLTAHHADDNAETVLMNFIRGTGLHGLIGIPASSSYIRRPLLPFSKNEIIQFAKEHQLEYVEDSSNESNDYTRNFFRNEIIPAIRQVYPQVINNLNDNINRFKEIEQLYKLTVDALKKKIVKRKGSEWQIPIKQLMGFENRALIYNIIAGFGFSEKQIDEVIKLAKSDSGKYVDSPELEYRLIKHRHWFIISPKQSKDALTIIIGENDKEILFENGILRLTTTEIQKPANSNLEACLDAKDITYPLILRKWKAGDYFYPLGMKKKKKISRFLIDQKFSKTEKENTWIIEMNKKIIWVVGRRIDERFKITDKTKLNLLIRLETA